MPVTEVESWTVLDNEGEPIAEIENFLAYLTAIERSPNTGKHSGPRLTWPSS